MPGHLDQPSECPQTATTFRRLWIRKRAFRVRLHPAHVTESNPAKIANGLPAFLSRRRLYRDEAVMGLARGIVKCKCPDLSVPVVCEPAPSNLIDRE